MKISGSDSSGSDSSGSGIGSSSDSSGSRKEEAGNRGFPFPSSRVTENITQLRLLKALQVLGVEIRLVHGDKDPVLPLRNSYAIASFLNGVEGMGGNGTNEGTGEDGMDLVSVNVMQCGHCPHEEDPEGFLRLLE
jgi:pimeloyl-ACP methyl ester carboxylesterase